MAFNQPVMAAFAQYVIANCNGRRVDLGGDDLNVDKRFGLQCMDLWIWIRYRLGFRDNLPTVDAASVWEMNWTAPNNPMWDVFDAVNPDQPCYPGDIGIMNRNFFGNGVGHIFMIVADLGNSIRVLELNGLGDGYEDDYMNQYGSPARIHEWPKTYLYGYLRWIGPTPTVSALGDTITPIQEDEISMAAKEEILARLEQIVAWENANFQALAARADQNRDLLAGFLRDTVAGGQQVTAADMDRKLDELKAQGAVSDVKLVKGDQSATVYAWDGGTGYRALAYPEFVSLTAAGAQLQVIPQTTLDAGVK